MRHGEISIPLNAQGKEHLGELNAYVGREAVAQARRLIQLAALGLTLALAAVHPSTWRRTIRAALVRQIISLGVQSTAIICFLGVCLGVLLVVEYQQWVGKFLQLQVLSSIMVVVIVRELGPLLVNLVLIARSGSAIATELALLQVGGEARILEGQGISPIHFLILPRVLAFVVSAFCLTVIFIAVSFLGVYFCGQWIGAKTGPLNEFLGNVLAAVGPADVANAVLKSLIPAALAGTACCLEGLTAGDTFDEVPRASQIAVQRSVVMLFVTCAFVSLATYL